MFALRHSVVLARSASSLKEARLLATKAAAAAPAKKAVKPKAPAAASLAAKASPPVAAAKKPATKPPAAKTPAAKTPAAPKAKATKMMPAPVKEEPLHVKTLSPYAAFIGEIFEKNKKAATPLPFTEVTKVASQEWKKLSDEDKLKYTGRETTTKPKRSRRVSALDNFRGEKMKNKDGKFNLKDISAQWNAMTQEQKDTYKSAEPVAHENQPDRKKSAWQMFLTEYLQKTKESKEPFGDRVKQASVQFKALSDTEKQAYVTA